MLHCITNYRKCNATAIYICSDLLAENAWNLGWGENNLQASEQMIIDNIIEWENR